MGETKYVTVFAPVVLIRIQLPSVQYLKIPGSLYFILPSSDNLSQRSGRLKAQLLESVGLFYSVTA